MNIQTGHQRNVDVLQLFRGCASLAVCVAHALTYVDGADTDPIMQAMVFFGYSGVDLFFCISGFVMAYTTQGMRNTLFMDFVSKRFSRVFPAYTVMTLLFVVSMKLEFLVLRTGDPDYHFKFNQVLRSIFFIPLHLTGSDSGPLWGSSSLMVGWTLNYEMYFYAIFAISLLFRNARWILFFAWIVLTLIVFPMIGAGYTSLTSHQSYQWSLPYLNLMTSPLIWEFTGGVIACFIYQSGLVFRTREMAWIGVALSAAFACWMISTAQESYSVPHWGLAYFVLLTTAVVADKTLCFRIPRAFMMLGRISFSLYLVHLIVQGLVGVLFAQFPSLGALAHGYSFLAVLTMLCVVAALPVHVWIEVRLSKIVLAMLQNISHSTPAHGRGAEV